MVSLMAVFLALTAGYIAVLLWVAHKGSDRFQLVGPLLMVRTQAGKRSINKLAKRKWWGTAADVFIVLTVLAGLAMVVLVAWQNTLLFTHTQEVRQNPPSVEQTLAIPGINPVIPVGYGLFALIVALVIHEGGHGVLARFAHLKVKSLGLLFLIVPIGAFVEPDEEELQGATLREKLRMFAAGPGPNMVLGAVCVILFSQVMVPAMAPASEQGVAILRADEELPAYEAGLRPGDVIHEVGGLPTDDATTFSRVLDHHATTLIPQGAKFTGIGETRSNLTYTVAVPEDAAEGAYNISGQARWLPLTDGFQPTGTTTVNVTCPADAAASTPDGASTLVTDTDGEGNVTRSAPEEVECGTTFTVELRLTTPAGTEYWTIVEQVPETWTTQAQTGGLRGDSLAVSYTREGTTAATTVEPVDKHTYFDEQVDGPVNASFRGVPFFGISPQDADGLRAITDNLESPFENQGLQGALFYLALPFINLQPFPSTFHDVFTVTGALAGLGGAFWILANSLYWLFWLNVVLGTFNALPLGPLDGGHMFRHSLHAWFRKRQGIQESDLRVLPMEEGSPKFIGRTPDVQALLDTVDDQVRIVNRIVGFALLGLILAPLIVPQFL